MCPFRRSIPSCRRWPPVARLGAQLLACATPPPLAFVSARSRRKITMASRTTRVEKPPPSTTMEIVLAPLSRAVADSARSKSSSLSFICTSKAVSSATQLRNSISRVRGGICPPPCRAARAASRGGSPDGKTLLGQGIELGNSLSAGPGDRR